MCWWTVMNRGVQSASPNHTEPHRNRNWWKAGMDGVETTTNVPTYFFGLLHWTRCWAHSQCTMTVRCLKYQPPPLDVQMRAESRLLFLWFPLSTPTTPSDHYTSAPQQSCLLQTNMPTLLVIFFFKLKTNSILESLGHPVVPSTPAACPHRVKAGQ